MKYWTFLICLFSWSACFSFQEKGPQFSFGIGTVAPFDFVEAEENETAHYTLFVTDLEGGVESESYTIFVGDQNEFLVELEEMGAWLTRKVGGNKEKYAFRGSLKGGEFVIPMLENYFEYFLFFEDEYREPSFFKEAFFPSRRCFVPVMQGWGEGDVSQSSSKEGAPFFNLPLTSTDKQNIRKLITSMADKSYVQLFIEKKALEKLGDKIRPIYPLRFMGCILEDPYLRRCLQIISEDSLKWGPFISGFEENMKKEEKSKSFHLYAPGFAELLQASQKDVESFLNNKDYTGLVKYFLVN